MNAYCPECETELDEFTGICPACHWDPRAVAASMNATSTQPEMSLTERYRGTEYDMSMRQLQRAALASNRGVSRGRAAIALALILGVILYGVIMSAMGVV